MNGGGIGNYHYNKGLFLKIFFLSFYFLKVFDIVILLHTSFNQFILYHDMKAYDVTLFYNVFL